MGQFGSSQDSVDYNLDTDVAVLNLGFPISRWVELTLLSSYMTATGSMNTISFPPLPPEAAAALPDPDVDYSQVNQLSNVDVRRSEVSLGGRFVLPREVLLEVFYSYVDYDDKDPYIEDASGTYQVIAGSLGWQF